MLDQTELDAIRSIIKEEVSSAHSCRFNFIDADEVSQAAHAVGVVKDLGDGELTRGIELIRDNHKWLNLQRQRSQKISMTILLLMVTAACSGLATAIWLGLKQMVKVD